MLVTKIGESRRVVDVVRDIWARDSEVALAHRQGIRLRWHLIRVGAVAAFCAFALQPLLARAQATLPMSPDRSSANHPVVGVSASGVPLVNIVRPNPAGVSLNNFTQYNVGTSGAVIVNTPHNAQTQIAGWVQGNPLMGNTPARTIINQVTSGNPTQLLGPTEIAGHRANLVIANPAGITCAGCGFINTPRASLTTGLPNFNTDGSLAGFDVRRGHIDIDGAGLDARGSQIDLLARAMRINGQVWAQAIEARAGANRVGYEDGSAVAQAGEGPPPEVAIDVRALGSMYANSVRLVGTEAGLGVRDAGTINSLTGTIHLSVNGAVTIEPAGRIESAGGAQIDAESVSNHGVITSQQSVHIDAANRIENDGTVSTDGDAVFTAPTLMNHGDIYAGVDAQGSVSRAGSVTLTGETITSDGTLVAGGQVTATGATISLDGGTAVAGSTLGLEGSQSVSTRGAEVSARRVAVKTEGAYANDGGVLDAREGVSVVAHTVSNGEGHLRGGQVTVTAEHLDNAAGEIASHNATSLTVRHLDNTNGVIRTPGALLISAAGTVNNTNGEIHGGRALNLSAETLSSSGQIDAPGDLTLDTHSTLSNTGQIAAGQHLTLSAQGDISNAGSMSARAATQVAGQSITNTASGEIIGNQATQVQATASVLNEGLIDGGTTRVAAGDTVTNQARIYGDTLAVSAQTVRNEANADHQAAVIASRGDLDIGAQTIDNRDGSLIHAEGSLRIGAELDELGHATETMSARLTNHGAQIDAGGDIRIAAQRFENLNAGLVLGQVTEDAGRQLWYTVPGSTEPIDPSSAYLYQVNDHAWAAGANYGWLGDDDYKVLLLPSAQYPFQDYAPYTRNGTVGDIDRVYWPPVSAGFGGLSGFAGGGSAGTPTASASFRTVPEAMWQQFGVALPPPPLAGVSTTAVPRRGAGWFAYEVPTEAQAQRQAGQTVKPSAAPSPPCTQSAAAACASFKTWYQATTQAYQALNAAVIAYDTDVRRRLVRDWTLFDVHVTTTRDTVVRTQPARITAGGSTTILAQSGENRDSVLATGAHGSAANVVNIDTKGQQTASATGRAGYTHVESGGAFSGDERKTDWAAYTAPIPPKTIDLPTTAGSTASGASPVKQIVPDVAIQGLGTRTVAPEIRLPSSALYQVATDPGSRFLIETDPRFTDRKTWLSSDVMMAVLNASPAAIQKRLGDGFYEQQLIQQQILVATGQRFIGDYTDNQRQYQALMNSGAQAAQRFGLNIGTALTEPQMAALTSDIVWLVNQTVTLPDGSEQAVLAPQVYLRAQTADVTGTGTIISGANVVLNHTGGFENSGTIASRGATLITAESITNTGQITGQTVGMAAAQDLNNLGGLIQGEAVALSAGRDANLASTTATATTVNGVATALDRLARVNAGTLSVTAGRDFNTQAAHLTSTGSAVISAGRDANLGTLTESSTDHVAWNDKNRTERETSNEVGTVMRAGGPMFIQAGQDLNATAALIAAQGALGVDAGRNVNLMAGQHSARAYDAHEIKERGFFSSKTTQTADASNYTESLGTTLSGQTVGVHAGGDIATQAATVVGTGNVDLTAEGNLTLGTANTTNSETHRREVKKSGLGSMGGVGFSYGTTRTTDTTSDTITGAQGSLVGSLEGNVAMHAGKVLKITGSDVVGAGDVTGVAKEVLVEASQTTLHHDQAHEEKRSGVTLALKAPVIDAIQNVNQQAHSATRSQDGRATALHAMAAASGAVDAADAGKDLTKQLAAGKMPDAKLELSFGSSSSQSRFSEASTQHNGSTVKAGGLAALIATGDKADGQGNLTIQGSTVSGQNVLFDAVDKVQLLSANDTESTRSTNQSHSGSIGASIGTGGVGVSGSLSNAHGDGNTDTTSSNNTHVSAAQLLTINSGGDTVLKGAVATAQRVTGTIGGNLTLESVQDTSQSAAHQTSAGGGFNLGTGGGSGSLSYQHGHADGSYAGVSEQTGIQAGQGGFNLEVAGNTKLKGAYIASEAPKALNHLKTGTLSFEDIENQSSYHASSFGVSMGGGYGDGGNNYATHGPTSGSSSGKNPGGALPVFVSEDGSSRATTRSAISDASIDLTDPAHQTQDLATLNRDTSNLNGMVKKTPNLQDKLSSQSDLIDAAQAAAEAVSKRIGDYANRKHDAAIAAADTETDPERKAQYLQNAKDWGEGGDNRTALHMAGGALTGGLTGGGLGAAGGALGAGLSAKLAPQLNNLAQSIKENGPTGNQNVNEMLGNLTSNLLAGGAGALVGGGAGAMTAASEDRFNRQLHQSEAEKLAQLQKGRSLEDQHRLAAAECALVHCADGLSANDPAKSRLQALQDEGQKYMKEQDELKGAGAFDGYGGADRLNDWFDRNQVSNRSVGAVQGVMGAATAAAALGSGCSTIVACGAGAIVAGTSLDYSKAGFEQLVNGNPTPTYGERMLETLGLSPEAAALTYGAANLGGTVGIAGLANQAAKKSAAQSNAARLSYTPIEQFGANGIQPTAEIMQTPQVRAVVDVYLANGLSLDRATDLAAGLVRTAISLPTALTVTADTELIKVVPRGALAGDTIGPKSPFFITREQYDALSSLSADQIANRLGLPVEQAIRGGHFGFDVYSMKPLPGRTPTVFTSEIAPIQQGHYSATGGAQQVLVPNRTQWTDPNTNKIGEIRGSHE